MNTNEHSILRNVQAEIDIAVTRAILAALSIGQYGAIDAKDAWRRFNATGDDGPARLFQVTLKTFKRWLDVLFAKSLVAKNGTTERPNWVGFTVTDDGRKYLRGFLPAPVGLRGAPVGLLRSRSGGDLALDPVRAQAARDGAEEGTVDSDV